MLNRSVELFIIWVNHHKTAYLLGNWDLSNSPLLQVQNINPSFKGGVYAAF